MSIFTSPFTGTVVTPTDVSYYALTFSTDQDLYWPAVVNPQQVPASRIMDCVATASGLSITLPDAEQGTLGADILFRNLGSFTIVIQDFNGTGSVTLAAGVAKYFYLTDNTTAAGVWGNVTFGAGTSVADAAALAGSGLTTVNGQLATTENIIAVTSTPIVTDTTRASTIVWNGGAGSMSLPVGSTLSGGWYIGFRNNGTGALTITPTSPATINGQSSLVTNPGDSGWILYQEATNRFFTVGLAAPSNITFTSAVYDVDSIPGNTFDLTAYAPIIQTYVSNSGTRTQTLAVTLPAVTQLYILSNDTGSSAYNVTFQCSGSSSVPFVVGNGIIATVLTDGTNIYPLTQTTAGVFQANDGSAGAPSYTFTNDQLTGMYLVGTSVLGLTANGTQIMSLNGSNPLAPVVKITAQLNASLISGGTF